AGRGIAAGARIAVLAEHRAPLLLALLAAQLADACFIPLDPTFPVERLGMILDDCRPQLVLHDYRNGDHAALAGQATAAIEALLEQDSGVAPPGTGDMARAPGALAYILFTSGSTGRPKGVQISRGAFANALASFAVAPGLDSRDVLGAATTVSFDIAMLELFLPLTVGARLVMIDKQVARDGMRLAALLAARGVTVFQGTPSTWKLLCAADARLALRAWCGGEQLPQALCDDLLARFAALWNLYGPTETTIWSAVQRQQRGQAVGAGSAVANTTIFLLDRHGQLAPDGAIGEICIGGDGVMRGYLDRPELSAAAFLPDLLRQHGALAYRTGDLGTWRADGTLAVMGRRDRQLKLDGFRIEPGDIEAALRALDGVADAAVTLHAGGGAPLLVGYVVLAGVDADGQPQALQRLAGQLSGKLPRYMIPGRFMALPALPLTLNGKLDQRALPAPDWPAQQAPSRQPEGALEQVVLQAWQQAFGRQDIGLDDDFFAIGGHSFIATRIHAQLARVLRGKVPLSQIFEASTVARLAAAIVAHEGAAGEAMRLAQATLAVQAMTPEARAALRARAQR
ncbi:non-ribosomal peptide synthetase, partial [Janthinobacterium sp. PC23-8]|uniref:non-ribosomal peptide synthetase n=1 Tax=Janthinobacterium sp. PC23-8 TaxID=2012679 RepID=UPI000BC709F4